jgi:hypothetical protein
LLEVTSLKPEAVSERSGWPDELSDRARAFGMITTNLWRKAKAKAPQLGGHEVARVLAICLTHPAAGALVGTLAAQWLMTSQPKLSVTVGDPVGAIRETTDLRESAFLAVRDDRIVPVRQSISAVLLVAIWDDSVNVVGLLHPEPTVPFDYGTFRDLPFRRLDWPVKDGVLKSEWVISTPAPRVDRHVPVLPTDEELRGH